MEPVVEIREFLGRKFLYVEGEERDIHKRWWFDLESLRMMFWHQRPSGERRIRLMGAWSSPQAELEDYCFDGPLSDAVIEFLERNCLP
ncbi:MAG: hypothetical protein KatS3mg005_4137 [Bryobacteraceae bacterium]|nr:MAG: hypothetical protein KatS3mg005_4137 [Bryobacteraceae bacterium]